MSPVSKRAALGVLTLAGLVLAVAGLWFLGHLGLSGTASFRATPATGRIVVLDPSVLNRIDSPVTITAKAKDGGDVWVGRAAPSDARSLVGKAAATSVTGVSISGWKLETAERGTGTAPTLAGADLWRQQVAGKGTATLAISQTHAPETVVVATPSGKPADLSELTLTWQRQAWSAEAVTALVLGLLLMAGGVAGLARVRGARPERTEPDAPTPPDTRPATTEQTQQTPQTPQTAATTEQTPRAAATTEQTPQAAATSEEGRR